MYGDIVLQYDYYFWKAKSRVKIVAEHIEAKPVTAAEKETATDSGVESTKPEAKPARQKKTQKELVMA